VFLLDGCDDSRGDGTFAINYQERKQLKRKIRRCFYPSVFALLAFVASIAAFSR